MLGWQGSIDSVPLGKRMQDTQVVGYCENDDISWFRIAAQKEGRQVLSLSRSTPAVGSILAVGFPSDAGLLLEEEVLWERAHPKEPFSETEWRALLYELRIRFQEASRRSGWGSDSLRMLGFTLRDIRLDGKRIMNPVGFSGRMLSLRGRATLLFSDRQQHHVPMPMLLDDAVLRLLDIQDEGICIVLDEHVSSVDIIRAGMLTRRATIAIGHAAIRKKFMRLCSLASQEAADELLRALAQGTLHARLERRVRQHFFSSLRAWMDGLISGAKIPFSNMPFMIFNAHSIPLFRAIFENHSRSKKDLFSRFDVRSMFFYEATQWFPKSIIEPRDAAVSLITKACLQNPELRFISATDRTLF